MIDNKKPLMVALHGLDSRAVKTMLFLKGPCGGAATVAVTQESADADLFDGDMPASKSLLDKHLQEGVQKPVIILSLWEAEHVGMIYVKKPVRTDNMLKAIDQAKKLLLGGFKNTIRPLKLASADEGVPAKQDSQPDAAAAKTAKEKPLAYAQNELFSALAAEASEEDVLEVFNYALMRKQQKSKVQVPPTEEVDTLQELNDWFESGWNESSE
jgi:hypothetical protein